MSFALSDGMDLDTYLGPMQKDAALQNAIFRWELIGGLHDVCSGFMKSTAFTQPSEGALCPTSMRDSTPLWFTFKQKSKEHSGLSLAASGIRWDRKRKAQSL